MPRSSNSLFVRGAKTKSEPSPFSCPFNLTTRPCIGFPSQAPSLDCDQRLLAVSVAPCVRQCSSWKKRHDSPLLWTKHSLAPRSIWSIVTSIIRMILVVCDVLMWFNSIQSVLQLQYCFLPFRTVVELGVPVDDSNTLKWPAPQKRYAAYAQW